MVAPSSTLPTWASAYTEFAFTKEALDAGRDRARAVWNAIPVDIALTDIPDSSERLEDAAYAYAILNEAIRIDGLRMPLQGGGIMGDPAPALPRAMSTAMAIVADFTRWATEVKTRLVMDKLEL